jgi:hypothetical protein
MRWFAKVREWIDGSTDESSVNSGATTSNAQAFAVRLARALEASLRQEALVLPDGPVVLPVMWLIFLSAADYACWRGRKREALHQWLSKLLAARAQALLPGISLLPVSLELRLDPTLPAGEFKLLPLWEVPVPLRVLELPPVRR